MKTITISAKCSDLFSAQLKDSEKGTIKEYVGYVPDFLGPDGYGDYVEMEIDVKTGQILNWKCTAKDLKIFA